MAKKVERSRPMTPEEVEAENIYLTNLLANEQLREGNASSQTMKHFLDRGSSIADLQREKLKNENLLLKAKIEEAKLSANMEKKLEEAMNAFKGYLPPVLEVP